MNIPNIHDLPLREVMLLISAKAAQCELKSGDLSDIGNEIGRIVGSILKMNDQDTQDFIVGFQHGVSLTNDTHHKIEVDHYRWNFNHSVGDVVKFVDGAFDEFNNKFMHGQLNPKLATEIGVVIHVYCDVTAYAYGSLWLCKVDFNGEIIETACGFFNKI